MALYRIQVVHAAYWRMQIKRWNSTFHYLAPAGTNIPNAVAYMHSALQTLGHKEYPGGIAEIKVYASTGGVPVYSNTYFDYKTPGSWLSYTGRLWTPSAFAPVPDAGETAALFEIAAGLSVTGKPVTLKTYWHAIPTGSNSPATADVIPSQKAGIIAGYNALQALPDLTGSAMVLVSPKGSPVATTATLRDAYVTHQRVRGKRHKKLAVGATVPAGYSGKTIIVPPLAN